MNTLNRDELLEVIVSLDNEAARVAGDRDTARLEKLRSLKWKVFSFLMELDKREAA